MAPRFGQSIHVQRPGVVLGILLVLSLVCVTMYAREGDDGAIHSLQSAVSGIFVPLKAASGGVSAAEQSISDRVTDAQADPNSLTALREQNEQLRQRASALEEYRLEAERLEGLLEMRTTYQAQGVPARVLSRSTDAWNQVVTIDAGAVEGVRAGLPVMGPSGLVGQVVSTSDHASDVRLLRDSSSGVAVIIQSSREEGIVHGSIEGLLYLDDISDEVEVNPGDVLITSGLGGGYFRGIMVGTVLKVEGEAGATTRKIIVDANESADPLEEVYVVTSMTSKLAEPEKDLNDTSGSGTAGSDALAGYADLDGDGVAETYVGGETSNGYGYDAYGTGAY